VTAELPLQPWHDFFLLIGAAAATLLGLVFVSASIAATVPNEKLGNRETRSMWVAPIIYAFLRVLVVCALGVVPGQTWISFGGVIAFLGVLDLGRIVYLTRGLLRHHRTLDPLDGDDWRWLAIYPALATLLILGAGIALVFGFALALFVLAFGVMVHLVVGVHNSWELADWLATAQ
jgi:hypothetical protein